MPNFTPKQASETLEIPPSSLRRYRSQWAAYLSAPDKTRRLTQADLDTLGIIRDHTGKKTRGEIEAILQGTPPENFVFDEQPRVESSSLQPVEILENLVKNLTDEHKTALAAKDEHIIDLRKQIDLLRTDLEESRTPWWKRLRD